MKAKNEIKKNVSEKQTQQTHNNVQKQTQSKNQQTQQKVSFDFDFEIIDVEKRKVSKEKKFNWQKIFERLAQFIVYKEVKKIQQNGFEVNFDTFTKEFMLSGEFDGKTTINYQLVKYNYKDDNHNKRVEKNYKEISKLANDMFKQLNMNIKVKVTKIDISISRKNKTIAFAVYYEKI